ncbi:MAG: LysR family glycine cleavage system transcriptional activator [Paracoccaceae bacterium]|jgi:LysR family glycine cleavage system transcriptional activator
MIKKNNRKLPLTSLRTFEAAARLLSFKDAAQELNVSATTVSNQIRELERDWKCSFFIRRTRSILLTDKGRSLAGVLTSSFEKIKKEVETHMDTGRKKLVVATGPIFGSRWLAPRLKTFTSQNPDIELVIEHSPRITSGSLMTADIAIDWGLPHGWSGIDSSQFLSISYSPVLSRKLMELYGPLDTPKDLLNFPIIHYNDDSEWSAWFKLAGVKDRPHRNQVTIIDANIATQAALDGHGVVLGIFPLIQNYVNSNSLIKPFDKDLAPDKSYHILTKRRLKTAPEVLLFQRWLKEQGQSDNDVYVI